MDTAEKARAVRDLMDYVEEFGIAYVTYTERFLSDENAEDEVKRLYDAIEQRARLLAFLPEDTGSPVLEPRRG